MYEDISVSANQVQRLADDYWIEKCKGIDQQKLNFIQEKIIEEAKIGKYYLTINEKIDELILNRLGLRGFRWSIEDHMFITITNIYWNKK